MADKPVTAQQYPHLDSFVLTSKRGSRGNFLGRIVAQALPCSSCSTSDTVTVYLGPQHGLAFDEPVTPFDVAPVNLELTWCTNHGMAGMRLLSQDGTEHNGL